MLPTDAIWSVSALNFEIKTMLEKGIGSIWIEGEISNFSCPASGHWYFSLKDQRAQLRAAMFKNRNARASFRPQNGQQVLIRAQVTLYEARGEFQVIVEHIEEAGIGRLMREFEALKKQLSNEGLFASEHKKTVPARARHIGIITSPTGAALRDVLSVIRRRSPSSEVTLFPTAVQGEQAASQIVNAIELANRYAQCDVLLLVRGGGSLEDLWSFNEEIVARAVYNSTLPIVSGVGHEIDFTITDFVADVRAPTPSVAAETVTMDQYELMSQIDLLSTRLIRQCQLVIDKKRDQQKKLSERILRFHPQRQMASLKQRLDYAQNRLLARQSATLQQRINRAQLLTERIRHQHPGGMIELLSRQIEGLQHQLILSSQNTLKMKQHRFQLQARSLDNLSPLKTLSRGFAAVSRQGEVISESQQLRANDEINIRFQDGEKLAIVK